MSVINVCLDADTDSSKDAKSLLHEQSRKKLAVERVRQENLVADLQAREDERVFCECGLPAKM